MKTKIATHAAAAIVSSLLTIYVLSEMTGIKFFPLLALNAQCAVMACDFSFIR